MPDLFSPKQVARAIGVSESSLKRWCDQGLLPSQATPGGHRKLPLSGVMEFLRQGKHALVDPTAIGLPMGTGGKPRSLKRSLVPLRDALVAGEDASCRRILLDLYLDGLPLCHLCDELLMPVFAEIGEMWHCGDIEVYRERRACRLCSRALHELRSLLPPPAADAPVAMGGAPQGDIYELPTTMVEIVLREAGWQATSLGSTLPLTTLAAAITENRPKMLWLSVSYLAEEQAFLADYAELAAVAAGKTALVVGGRGLTAEVRSRMQFTAYCADLRELKALLPQIAASEPAN
ncbi:MAG: B12-binding domain-containing protein [Pirellulaceae bacterium]|nr:B12-binding domain-containing protein [Pirellulaceae bacterium]